MDKGDLGISFTVRFAGAHTGLLLCRLLQTMDMGGLGSLAIADF